MPATPELDTELTSIDPCEFLDENDLDALDLPEGQRDDAGDRLGCVWQQGGGGITTAVRFQPHGGLTALEPSAYDRVLAIESFNGRDIRWAEADDGDCRVDLAFSEQSMVTLSTLVFGDLERACEVTERLAELIEPQLP